MNFGVLFRGDAEVRGQIEEGIAGRIGDVRRATVHALGQVDLDENVAVWK